MNSLIMNFQNKFFDISVLLSLVFAKIYVIPKKDMCPTERASDVLMLSSFSIKLHCMYEYGHIGLKKGRALEGVMPVVC